MLAPTVIFIILIIAGLWLGELDKRQTLVFLSLWTSGLLVCMAFSLSPYIFVTIQALLDCVLILMIFGENIRIS